MVTAKLVDGGVVRCEVVKASAKTTLVRVPVLHHAVLSWDRLRIPNARMNPEGTPCNLKTFEIATNDDILRAYVAKYLGRTS
jgi:hypothetical protein